MGWNAKNRLVIGRDVKPGQQIQLAVFGINGPISKSPTNFIFLHYARLEFHRGTRGPVGVRAARGEPRSGAPGSGGRRHRAAQPEAVEARRGLQVHRGPGVGARQRRHLLFSDPNSNTIYRWKDGELQRLPQPSGYSGADMAEYGQPGSNGLTLDAQGRLTIDEHGNHRVIAARARWRPRPCWRTPTRASA